MLERAVAVMYDAAVSENERAEAVRYSYSFLANPGLFHAYFLSLFCLGTFWTFRTLFTFFFSMSVPFISYPSCLH